jgi:hypothetical protein
VTSEAQGRCGPYHDSGITDDTGDNITIANDVWNPINGWSQTVHATSPGNWHVVANMPKGNTAVISYPSDGVTYDERPLSTFSSIISSFSENMHATSQTSAWAAYDIWLNNWNNEIMIQNDFANQGACDQAATATFGGSDGVPVQNWKLCDFGSELVWQLNGGKTNEQTGSVDVLAMLNWLADHGYVPNNSNMTAIGYGWEICSTGGVDETFTNTGFTITSKR